MGVSAPAQPSQTTLGRLAVDFDRVEYESNGRLRVAGVVPLGPAALAALKPGDYILQVEGRGVSRQAGAAINLDELLDHTIGRRIALSVAASPTAAPRQVMIKPTDQQTE
jgi:S1-C subfamily serine protease